MGFEYVSKLPTPDEIRAQFPLAPELAAEKARKDAAIRDVFTGDSDKFLVIIGPCSADREDAVIDYVNRLAKVQEKVKDKLILVPRIYTNKPRTTGDGYKGHVTSARSGEVSPNLWQGLHGDPSNFTCVSSKKPASRPQTRCSTRRTWRYLSDVTVLCCSRRTFR